MYCNDNGLRLCGVVDGDCIYIWNDILLALTKQEVRCYLRMFQFECVIKNDLLCIAYEDYDTITIAHSPATEIHYIDNGLRLCAYMERYCVGCEQTVCTLSFVHV